MSNYVLAYVIVGFIFYLLSDMRYRHDYGKPLSFAAGGFIVFVWPVLVYMIAYYAFTGKKPDE